ncbi:uncharacterized protein LOC122847455 [Aphidius gifuensis]|uniref:uncharacterized protein LOC122847455 n=1 Tax=Aphidius gifuensis TaxID=684658 RepID=UPI001CDC990C|nr:uncharacterized protein LOC122847455 [Aphidius gifuensis]
MPSNDKNIVHTWMRPPQIEPALSSSIFNHQSKYIMNKNLTNKIVIDKNIIDDINYINSNDDKSNLKKINFGINLSGNIDWCMLASFGFGLWIALCISDCTGSRKFNKVRFNDDLSTNYHDTNHQNQSVINLLPCVCSILTLFLGIFMFIETRILRQKKTCFSCQRLLLNCNGENLLMQLLKQLPQFYKNKSSKFDLNDLKIETINKIPINSELYRHLNFMNTINYSL